MAHFIACNKTGDAKHVVNLLVIRTCAAPLPEKMMWYMAQEY